jgi:hypothetical protein
MVTIASKIFDGKRIIPSRNTTRMPGAIMLSADVDTD